MKPIGLPQRKLLEMVPDASVACYDNRQFLGRAVRYLVGGTRPPVRQISRYRKRASRPLARSIPSPTCCAGHESGIRRLRP